ncbi:MAG: UDP-N-acetylmuramate dehydrogenase [Heliobacteriaceae bacterium]|nr:UDP-N-acetylmuramate dehydrogenase [Heliobacteriaceae bacterium]
MQVEFKENFDISGLTTFKIGGKVNKIYFPRNLDEFGYVVKKTPKPKVSGNLSNMLISSEGYDGVIISTSKLKNFYFTGDKLYSECGVKVPFLAQTMCDEGLSGIEFMIGFPGSVGGTVYMNASASGTAVADVLDSAVLYSKSKGKFTLSNEEMQFGYRTSICQKKPYIVLAATFNMRRKPVEKIMRTIEENLIFRKNHHPLLKLPNAGSIFKNPKNNIAGRVIDEAGMKCASVGGAQVWDRHANFIVNTGNATSLDVLELMLKIYDAVYDKFKIKLVPEIEFLGGNNAREVEIWEILKKKRK